MEFELYAWLRLYADKGIDPEQLIRMLMKTAVVVDELNAVPRTPPGRDAGVYKQAVELPEL
ncbi:hypothetical protein [Haloferax sp. DFSO52]|uniref:hypothetical protein n=1 Tax=Haloferax sp. DFSO52 TaxID=3388505 RepID=UPI003A83892A